MADVWVPRVTLQAVLPPSVKKDLQTMIDYAKISGVLFGQWGFDVHHGTTRGMSALFYGPPGRRTLCS